MLTLDLADDEVLDLRGCGLDARAAANDLRFAGTSINIDKSDVRNPHLLLRRIPPEALRRAGYRAVCIRESVNWDAGERHAESILIADLPTIVDREVVPLPDKNYQFPDGGEITRQKGGLVCLQCRKPRGGC
jgi:hypothetical protein